MAIKKEVNKYPVIPQKLRDLLAFNKWSVSKIAREIGVSSTTINKEINEGWVKKDILLKIARVLKYSKGDLFKLVCFGTKTEYEITARKQIEKYLDAKHQ